MALDVSVQASIVRLLDDLRTEHDLALVFVTHNLAVVRTIADDVVVIRNGSVVESAPVGEMFDNPVDEYTKTLLADSPRITAGCSSDARTDIGRDI